MPGEETVKEKESQKNGAADAKSKSGKAGKHPTGVDDTIDDPPPNGSRTPSEQDELEYVPDGGKDAWVVVLGSSLALFASAGMINAYGTFQNYYETTLLPSTSSSIISLIGSVQVFFLYFLGTFTGRAFDAYGTKVLIPAGSFICVFSLMMVSLCQKDQVYQVFLSQGVLFGIGIALLFNPSIAVLGHWFRRRRSLAIGLTTGGSATGGVVFPILLEQLIPKVGFGWAVRIGAFILLACLIVSCLTIRTRLPLTGRLSFRTAIDVGGFRDPRYTLAAVGSFLLFYGFFIPYFYIQIYANYRGVSPQISKYLLAILNAMNVPSRILPGYVADNVGVMNVFVPAAVICCALILGLWLPSRNAGEIISFAALYGLFSGAFVSLVPSYIATISPREKYGARLGSVYMVIAVAVLVGTPTGGALLKETDEAHFRTLIVFCGVMTVAGTVVLAMAGAAGHPAVRRFLKRRSDDESTTDGEKTPVDVEAGGGEGH
ncbi:major facilitator superfamily domain-containing protein [Trametes maxima]|nr:major facilitator superfamily domain-containing protein [Trametes maxima]